MKISKFTPTINIPNQDILDGAGQVKPVKSIVELANEYAKTQPRIKLDSEMQALLDEIIKTNPSLAK